MKNIIKDICANSGIVLLLTAALLAVPSVASASTISLLNNGDFEAPFTAPQSIANAIGE